MVRMRLLIRFLLSICISTLCLAQENKTLTQSTLNLVEPARPSLVEEGIADDHFNISFVPGEFDDDEQRPVGQTFYVKYQEEGQSDWIVSFWLFGI